MQEEQRGKMKEAAFDLKTLHVSRLNACAKGNLAKKQYILKCVCGGGAYGGGQQEKGNVWQGMESKRRKEAEERVGH